MRAMTHSKMKEDEEEDTNELWKVHDASSISAATLSGPETTNFR